MTIGHEHMDVRFAPGMGLSALLHALILALAFIWLGPAAKPPPPHYDISLVDMPSARPAAELPAPTTPADTPAADSPVEINTPWKPPESLGPTRAPLSTHGPLPGTNSSAIPHTPALSPLAFYDPQAIQGAVEQSRQQDPSTDGVTFDTKDMMYAPYMEMLRQQVESKWEYPRSASQQGIYGDLIIRFVILKDGSLGEVKVLRTSGHKMLDDAAVKALNNGVPYWPLPKGWDRQSITIEGRFIYVNMDKYLR